MTLERLARPVVFGPFLLFLSASLAYWLADRGLPNPDEGAYLTAAAKILRGGVFYRDIDAYPFPGSSYLLAGVMSVFGEHLSVARGLAGASWCVTVLAVYAAALRLMSRERAALCGLSLLPLKFWAFPNFTAYFYSDLALAFAGVALAVFLRQEAGGRAGRLVVVGAAGAFAILSKQNTGIYLCAAIGALLVLRGLRRDTLRELLAFAGGLALVAVPVCFYFASEGLLGQMIFSGLVRPFTGYLPTSGVSSLPPLAWWELGQLVETEGQPYLPMLLNEMIRAALVPGPVALWWWGTEIYSRLVYTLPVVAFGVLAVRGLRGRAEAISLQSGLICLAIALSVFPRADHPHVINIYPVVLLTLFSLGSRERVRAAAVVVAVWLLVTAGLAARYDSHLGHRLSLDRASLWVRARDAWMEPTIRTIRREVPPGEALFVYGHEAYYYFLADRYFPWPFSQLYPGMAGGDGGRQLGDMLLKTRPPIVVEGVRKWPGTPHLASYTGYVRTTLGGLYRDDTATVVPADERPPRWVFGLFRLKQR